LEYSKTCNTFNLSYMIKRTEIQSIRDRMHCDIVIHSTSKICLEYGNDKGDLYLKEPIVYDRFNLDGDGIIKTKITSICCTTGELYDEDVRRIKYSRLPWRILKEIHRRVVQLKAFTFKNYNV
jgi:hypothetical protein